MDKTRREYKIEDEEEVKNPDEKPLTETLDFGNPDFSFVPNTTHDWKQRGYYIHCTSCGLGHGVFIGAHKIMVGIDADGQPIVKARSQLNLA